MSVSDDTTLTEREAARYARLYGWTLWKDRVGDLLLRRKDQCRWILGGMKEATFRRLRHEVSQDGGFYIAPGEPWADVSHTHALKRIRI